jgi:membrane-bound metal-dependent hydrolase YbcI (DUF457 family)
MNFKGHITGGFISGALLTTAAFVFSSSAGPHHNLLPLFPIFGVTVFFSLFPDLDVGSIQQRWFYRAIFILLLYLGYQKYYELATLVAIVAITPILDHHRGWTHNYFSALLVPLFLMGIYECILAKDYPFHNWSFKHIYEYLKDHLWLVIASIAGWYTHLLLDSKLPLLKNDRKHY